MPQIIEGADIGENQVGFPTVIKAEGLLADPIDTWYLWCAPHDGTAGVFLFTAPEPDGPWTIANGGEKVVAAPGASRHISSPHVLWWGGRLMMWAHILPASGNDTQTTYALESADGVTWTWLNGGEPVIPLGTGDDLDTGNATYLSCTPWNGVLYGYYQGSGLATGAHVCEATSTDGITWTKTRQLANGSAWSDVPGHTSGKPVPIVINGKLFVYYTCNYGAGKLPTNKYRQRMPGGTFSPEWMLGIQPRPSQWDAWAVSAGDIVFDGTKFWLFYSANPVDGTSEGEAIGVAECTFPQGGFDLSTGKG